MSFQDITNFINAVGFPVAACVFLALNNMRMLKTRNEEIAKIFEHHHEEMTQLKNALDNNTKTIAELSDLIRKE